MEAQAQQALAAEPTGVEVDLTLWRQHLGIAAAEGVMSFILEQIDA